MNTETSLNSHFDIAYGCNGDWTVNGLEPSDETSEFLSSSYYRDNETCSYCSDFTAPSDKSKLEIKKFKDFREDSDEWHFDRDYIYSQCSNCGFWSFSGWQGGNKCMDSHETTHASSIASRFSPTLPDECSYELAQYIRRNPNYWKEMHPKQLELLVRDIFKANFSDAEVFHVGKSHDRGIDVVFIDSGKNKWLIQAKRRGQQKISEGYGTLQSLLGSMALDGSRHGIIASTADSFSHATYAARSDAEKQGFFVKLLDKGKLDRMMTPMVRHTPWENLFGSPELKHLSSDIKNHFWSPFDGQLKLPFENFCINDLDR